MTASEKSFRLVLYLSAVLAVITAQRITAQEYEKVLLSEIADNVSSYKNKTITLRLRLKYIDRVFNRIVFYDRKNTDIIFDIEKMKDRKEFMKESLNLHPGMEYLVRFTVTDIGSLGLIIGDLTGFTPVALMKIP